MDEIKEKYLEEIVTDIYEKIYASEDESDLTDCKITLGEIDDPKAGEKVRVLEYLKKRGVMEEYKIENEEVKSFVPAGEDHGELHEDFIMSVAHCKVKPQSIFSVMQKIGLKKKKLKFVETGEGTFEKSADKKPKEKPNSNELHLDHTGNLWREPQNKYCYAMIENSDRHKILRYLIDHKGYNKIPEISLHLDGKNLNTIISEIGKMRRNIKNKLKIRDLIEGKKGSGYRINPAYRVLIRS